MLQSNWIMCNYFKYPKTVLVTDVFDIYISFPSTAEHLWIRKNMFGYLTYSSQIKHLDLVFTWSAVNVCHVWNSKSAYYIGQRSSAREIFSVHIAALICARKKIKLNKILITKYYTFTCYMWYAVLNNALYVSAYIL